MNNEYPEDWFLALKYAAALEWDESEMRRVFKELGLSTEVTFAMSKHEKGSYMQQLSDLEMTKLCAEAMGYSLLVAIPTVENTHVGYTLPQYAYCPLHDDAQAMALVKKFHLELFYENEHPVNPWMCVVKHHAEIYSYSEMANNIDLNRAIVECVAKMEQAKHLPTSINQPEAWYEHGDPNKDDDPGSVNE